MHERGRGEEEVSERQTATERVGPATLTTTCGFLGSSHQIRDAQARSKQSRVHVLTSWQG